MERCGYFSGGGFYRATAVLLGDGRTGSAADQLVLTLPKGTDFFPGNREGAICWRLSDGRTLRVRLEQETESQEG